MFEMVRVTRRLGTTEIKVDGADPDLVRQLESDVEGRTYQFVVSAAPRGSAVLERPPTLPAAVAQAAHLKLAEELSRLRETDIPKLEREIRRLHDASIPDLVEQLATIRQSSQDRRSQLRYLLEAMHEDTDRLRISLSG
jgi:hypothetical protein